MRIGIGDLTAREWLEAIKGARKNAVAAKTLLAGPGADKRDAMREAAVHVLQTRVERAERTDGQPGVTA